MRRTQTLKQLETDIFSLRDKLERYCLPYSMKYVNHGKKDIYMALTNARTILVNEDQMNVREATVFVHVINALVEFLWDAVKL